MTENDTAPIALEKPKKATNNRRPARRTALLVGVIAVIVATICGLRLATPPDTPNISLIPQPAEVLEFNTEPFTLTEATEIVAPTALANESDLLSQRLRASTGFPLPIVERPTGAPHITLTLSPEAQGKESYTLESTAGGIVIAASSAQGIFNGTQTFAQLLPPFVFSDHPVLADWKVPAVRIDDSPRFEIRSLMLDVARSFLTVDEVKQVIDTAASVKISALHLHLTDDQGWRIQITNEGKSTADPIDYRLLTEVPGRTAIDAVGETSEKGRTGFYTQDDYRQIVDYAAARHIVVIPEVDLPGHTNAALHAIPELNTAGSSHEAAAAQPVAAANGTDLVGYSYLDPDSAVTDLFIAHVLGQVAALTPGAYLHLGGDESEAMVQVHGAAKYAEFTGRIAQVVRDTGKQPIGWNDYAATPLRSGDVVQYWRGDDAATQTAVAAGAQVVMSPAATAYLDMKYDANTPIRQVWWCQNECDFDTYYDWNPAQVIPGVGEDAIVGVEGALWSETVRGLAEAEFLIYPRIFAHAEIGWSPQEGRNVADFARRLSTQGLRLTSAERNFYDGSDVEWTVALAGLSVSTGVGEGAILRIGEVLAPGRAPEEIEAVIDFGDDSAPEGAVVSTERQRSDRASAGTYTLAAAHQYTQAGTYEGTMTAFGQVAHFIVTVE